MKRTMFVVAALSMLLAHNALAGNRHCKWSCNRSSDQPSQSAFGMSLDKPVRLADRHDLDDARIAISNESRKVDLILTNRVVAMQLSDRVLRKIDRKRDAVDDDGDDHVLGRAIKTAVLNSVRSILSHSAEVDVRDIESAQYRDGEIILIARNGDRLFADSSVDDDDVMRSFSEDDARAFVRQLRQRMARER
jgi:hypothetical protein